MAQLVTRQAELETLGIQVVTISFGTGYWAKVWLAETGSPFPFLIDETRAGYQAYGLEASWWRAWGVSNIWYYVQAWWAGREMFGKRGDTDQLGGDFLVDGQGRIELAHPSWEPTDRVEVAKVLALVGTGGGS